MSTVPTHRLSALGSPTLSPFSNAHWINDLCSAKSCLFFIAIHFFCPGGWRKKEEEEKEEEEEKRCRLIHLPLPAKKTTQQSLSNINCLELLKNKALLFFSTNEEKTFFHNPILVEKRKNHPTFRTLFFFLWRDARCFWRFILAWLHFPRFKETEREFSLAGPHYGLLLQKSTQKLMPASGRKT